MRVSIKVQLSSATPTGKIVGHFGLQNVHGIDALNDTVDAYYRGTVCVVLFNLSDNEHIVEIGDRIV